MYGDRIAVNGSAQYGAYTFENVVNKALGSSLNVNGKAMNFYWQHTPQVCRTPNCMTALEPLQQGGSRLDTCCLSI